MGVVGGGRRGLVFLLAALVLVSCDWRGIANLPLPVGRGTGSKHLTIYVQMPDTLALNTNSRVRVADVWVGTVRDIRLKNWIATLTLDLDPKTEPDFLQDAGGEGLAGGGSAVFPQA